MPPSRLRYPNRADVVDTGETVVDGRIVDARTVAVADLGVWIEERSSSSTVYDDAGRIVEDADALTDVELSVGQELELDDGTVWVVARPSRTRKSPRGPAFYSTPVRRLS